MAKKDDFKETPEPSLADELGQEMVSAGDFKPMPGETALDLWTRLSAKALELTMTRAALGDRQALATVYDMVKAPVLAETQMMELETNKGRLRSVSGGSKSQAMLNSAAVALIDGSVSTTKR